MITSWAHCFIQIEQCKVNYNSSLYLFWYQDRIAWSVHKRKTVIEDLPFWFISKICLSKHSDSHLCLKTVYKNWEHTVWYSSHHMLLVTNSLRTSWAIHTFFSSCWDPSEIPPCKSICFCYTLRYEPNYSISLLPSHFLVEFILLVVPLMIVIMQLQAALLLET